MSAFITFLSDYGLADEFVGVCHGVIARRCPEARVIDITHSIPPQDVLGGALVLRDALPYMPAGVHLAVVDPAVGRPGRRAVAARCDADARMLVGPDNGLLWPAAQRLGGIVEAVDIGRSPELLSPLSATFHGRDVFAPVAAALACGRALADVGQAIDAAALSTLTLPSAVLDADVLVTHVLRSDRYGNLALDASFAQLAEVGIGPGATFTLHAGEAELRGRHAETFADVAPGELMLYRDGAQMAALAINRGSAAARLGVETGQQLTLRAR